jgi:competence protein ComEC
MLLSLISGLIIGIWAGSLFFPAWAVVISCFILAAIAFASQYKFPGQQQKLLIASVFIFGIALGFARVHISDLYQSSTLSQFAGRKISAQGIIVDEPDVREHNVKLTVKLTQVSQAASTESFSEKVLVTVPIHPEFQYGDKISLSLQLDRPKPIDSDGRIFDYEKYLRVRGIWYVSRFAQVSLLSPGHGSIIKSLLFRIKQAFTDSMNRAVVEPESSLLAGLLLGTKQSLGTDLLGEFSRAGVSHVVVLSGYNIAIVAESIMAILAFASAGVSFIVGAISILLFTVLAGGGASAVRAAVMVLVALFAKHSNRSYSAARAFVIAVVAMLVWNPLLLAFDPSFQLSALATIGLIFVSPYFAPYLSRVPEKYGLREIVSSTLATQAVVLPFLIFNTGVLSLVSLPVNILILGTVPLTMLLGFVTGAVGLVSPYLAFIPALPTYILLWYQLTVVHIGATLPFGAVMLPAFSPFVLVLIYLMIAAGIFFLYQKQAIRKS